MTETPVVIEAALNGVTSPPRNPLVPITPEEHAKDALACIDAGATVIHTHTHDLGAPPEDAARRSTRRRTDPSSTRIPASSVIPTTGIGPTIEQRYRHVELLADMGVIRAAFVDTGSVNLGGTGRDGRPPASDYVYTNTFNDIAYKMQVCEKRGLGPSIAVFEPGFLRVVMAYERADALPAGTLVKFYFSAGGYLGGGDAAVGRAADHRSARPLSRDARRRGHSLGRGRPRWVTVRDADRARGRRARRPLACRLRRRRQGTGERGASRGRGGTGRAGRTSGRVDRRRGTSAGASLTGPCGTSATVRVMPNRGDQVVITNRKARHDYFVLESFECGVVLQGAEVKSIRNGRANLQDGYARVDDGEVWLFGMHVSPYEFAHNKPLDPTRKRKLLLHRREIQQLERAAAEKGVTLVPLRVYFKDGRAKVELAVARGKARYDKRQTLAERDAKRETERTLKEMQR